MVSNTSGHGEIVRDYCERFPNVSTGGLARMLVKEFPAFFTESKARDTVRWHRGKRKNGKGHRAAQPMPFTAATLPESKSEDIRPIKFDTFGRGCVISDVHIPYHSPSAIEAGLNHALAKGYNDFLYINGDLIDCYQLSHFGRDPRKRCFAGEILDVQAFLRLAVREFKAVWYKFGNHEQRHERFMFDHAAELLGTPCTDLQQLVTTVITKQQGRVMVNTDPDLFKIRFVSSPQVTEAAALTILHGHEYGKSLMSPVNPARGMFLRATACTLSGHLHRTSHHVERTIQERQISCWSTGCLCGLSPEYAPKNKWDHGFALMEASADEFHVDTKRVINGKVF